MGRTDAVARLAREEAFHGPIFERMERDDPEPATGPEDPHGGGKTLLEVRDLLIHRDPQRLKRLGRRIDPPRSPRLHARDEAAELVRRREPVLRPATDDRSCDARGLRLLAVVGEHAAKVTFAPAVHDVCRRIANVRVGTHVQRASRAKAEAAVVVRELDRREPEIQEDAVDRNEVVLAGHEVASGKVRANETRSVSEARELSGGGGDGRRVDIESQETPGRRAPLEDAGGMSARPDRPVEIPSAVARVELGEYLGQENRLVKPRLATLRSPGP